MVINMESKYKSFDELPLMLSVPEAAEVLGISAVSLYAEENLFLKNN